MLHNHCARHASEAAVVSVASVPVSLCAQKKLQNYWSKIDVTSNMYCGPYKWLDFGDIWPWRLTLRATFRSLQYF